MEKKTVYYVRQVYKHRGEFCDAYPTYAEAEENAISDWNHLTDKEKAETEIFTVCHAILPADADDYDTDYFTLDRDLIAEESEQIEENTIYRAAMEADWDYKLYADGSGRKTAHFTHGELFVDLDYNDAFDLACRLKRYYEDCNREGYFRPHDVFENPEEAEELIKDLVYAVEANC